MFHWNTGTGGYTEAQREKTQGLSCSHHPPKHPEDTPPRGYMHPPYTVPRYNIITVLTP